MIKKNKISPVWFQDSGKNLWVRMQSTNKIIVDAMKASPLFDKSKIKIQKVCNCGKNAWQETYPKDEYLKLNIEFSGN